MGVFRLFGLYTEEDKTLLLVIVIAWFSYTKV